MALTKYDHDGLHYWAPNKKIGGGWTCYKSSPKPPAAPDPVQTANAQTASNIATANAQAALNRNNQYTPWGNMVWSEGPKNSDGTSSWSSTITLDPQQQKLLNSSNQISQQLSDLGVRQADIVGQNMGALDYNSLPFIKNSMASGVSGAGQGIQNNVDMSGVSQMVGGDALAKAMQDNQNAAYMQQAAYLDSSYGQRQSDLENKLIQQGVTQNSDAWNRAVNNLGQQRTFDYNNAFNNSFSQGLSANNQLYNQGLSTNQNQYNQALNNAQFRNSAQNQGFGQGLASQQLANQAAGQNFNQSMAERSQSLQEMLQKQQQPINILNALRSGSQVSAPQFGSTPQGNIANTDIAGMYNNQYQGQLANYNSRIAQNNSMMNGLFGLGSAYLLSDRRLKSNIERVGTHDIGIGIYTWNYLWGEPGYGVMADEVEKVKPEAVALHPTGFKMVNYGAL